MVLQKAGVQPTFEEENALLGIVICQDLTHMLSTLIRNDVLGLFAQFVQPEVLLVLSWHFDSINQNHHQLRHSFRLPHRHSDGSLVQHLHIKGNLSFILKQFSIYLITRNPISLYKLTLKHNYIICCGVVGVGGEA
jgi:hypothetical protein